MQTLPFCSLLFCFVQLHLELHLYNILRKPEANIVFQDWNTYLLVYD